MKLNLYLLGIVLVLISSCKKTDDPGPSVASAKGVYILSEGNFFANNAKLSYRDAESGTVYGDYFAQQNPLLSSGLGDLANDMIIYGSKLYIVVNVSSNVTVLNATNGTFVSRIPIQAGSTDRQPRYAAAKNGKLYVTSYDGTVSVIDTTSLSVTNTINVGPNPEDMLIYNNKLFVANSGGFNTVPDSTVSVIDLSTNSEIARLKVGVNPQRLAVNSTGEIYVTAYGNFADIPASVTVINGNTNTVIGSLGSAFEYDHVKIYKDMAYFYNNYSGSASLKMYNTQTHAVVRDEFITDATTVSVVYGIDFDEQNDDVYICDAVNFSDPGNVTCFDAAGKKKFSFSVAPGISPNKVVFLR